MKASFPEAKIHCLDLPGVGTELSRDSAWSIPGIREDIRERWIKLQEENPGPWFLFGISLGGMITMDWIAHYPSDFQAVVLLNTSAANVSQPFDRLQTSNLSVLAKAALIRDPVVREKAILKVTTSMLADLDSLASEWGSIAADSKRLSRAFMRQISAAIRYQAPKKLPVPALFLTSAQDKFTDPSCSFKLARRFHSPLRMHPLAGHDVTIDDPHWVAHEIETWIAKKFQGALPTGGG